MKISPRLSGISLATFLLFGCLFQNEDSGFVSTYEWRILEIDRTAQTITTQDKYWYCVAGAVRQDSDSYEDNYRVLGGKLYRWTSGSSCMATILNGSSSDIVGTWTGSSNLYGSAPVSDSAFCDEETYADLAAVRSAFRKTTITEKITETNGQGRITGERCWGEMEGYMLTTNMGYQDDFEASEKNCSSVKITRASDSTFVRVEAEETSTGVKMKFTAMDTTCVATLPKDDAVAPSCTDGSPEEVFEACVRSTGFFGDSPYLKTAAEAAARKHRLLREMRRSYPN